ncbi:MAG: hypothetical protein ACI4SS_06885 [Clostridia bacterium]
MASNMKNRDIKRFLFRGRYIILAVGLICAAVVGMVTAKSDKSSYFPPLPDTDGEYITVVENLLEYCDKIDGATNGTENIKKYELASAMGEILNNRVAKDIDGVLESYTAKAEEHRRRSRSLENRAWQAYNNAVNGPDKNYAATMMEYIAFGIEAGNRLADAEYCENIVRLMSMDIPVDESAEEKTVQFINAAAEKLRKLTVPADDGIPVEAAVLTGFVGGIAVASVAVVLIGGLGLWLRLKKQKRYVDGAENGRVMERINFRG